MPHGGAVENSRRRCPQASVSTWIGVGAAKHWPSPGKAAAWKISAFAGVCDLTGEGALGGAARLPGRGRGGTGPATAAKLATLGGAITAGLRALPAKQARALDTVTLERTVQELRGVACISLVQAAPQRTASRWPGKSDAVLLAACINPIRNV